MKAIVFTGPKKIEVRELPLPKAEPGKALIKVTHAGVCGSDLTIYLGYHPRATAPLILGHEFGGHLAEDIPGLPKGSPVTVNPLFSCGICDACKSGNAHVCETLKLIGIDSDGGMAEYALVPYENIVAVPENVPPKRAAFIEPIAVAVHTLRERNFIPGDNALILGAGAIGLSIALTLREFGASEVTVCEPNTARLNIAAELGFKTYQTDENLLQKLLDQTNGKGFDFVFDCAGHQSVAEMLPDLVKVRGKIIIVAGYKNPPSMNFQKGMFKEFTIEFVRVYRPKDFEIASELARKQPLYDRIINRVLPVEKAQEGFDLLLTPSDAVKVMFEF